MKWIDLLESIDAARNNCGYLDVQQEMTELRVKLRQAHGKKLDADVPADDTFAAAVQLFIAPYVPAPVQPIDDGLLACVTQEEQLPLPEGAFVQERADGEGRMIIMPRTEKFVPQVPQLEDADENSVGKDKK
jgi:hypothetical protein